MDTGFAPFMDETPPPQRHLPTIDPPDVVLEKQVDPDILGSCPVCLNKYGITIDGDDLLIASGCILLAVLLYKKG